MPRVSRMHQKEKKSITNWKGFKQKPYMTLYVDTQIHKQFTAVLQNGKTHHHANTLSCNHTTPHTIR